MKKTGWKVTRCVVNRSREGFPLDRDGNRVDRVDSEGIPVSASGKKRSAYIWNKVDKNSVPAGGKFSYAKEFEIMGEYSLPIPLPDPERLDTIWVMLGGKRVDIATYKGKEGQDCPTELFEFRFAGKSQDTLSPLMGVNRQFESQYKYSIDVISSYDGKNQDYTVEIVPIGKAKGLIFEGTTGSINKKSTFSFDRGYEGLEGDDGPENFEIVFTQKGSGRKLTFDLYRRSRYRVRNLNLTVSRNSIAMGEPRNAQVAIYSPLSDSHKLTLESYELSRFPMQYPSTGFNPENIYVKGHSAQINLKRDYYEGDIVAIVGMGYPEKMSTADEVQHSSILQMSAKDPYLMKNQALVELNLDHSAVERIFKQDIGDGWRQINYPRESSSGNWTPSSMMLARLLVDNNKNVNVEYYVRDTIIS